MNHIIKLGEAQIRRDLEQHRRVTGVLAHPLAGVDHLRQEIVERGRLLQVAQARGVRRRDIDREIARHRRESLNQIHVIGDAVARVLVSADIDADDAAMMRARREPPQHRIRPVIVEPQPIDHRLVAFKPK